MPKFRYLNIRDGYQKGSPFDGYSAVGYWTIENILDDTGTDVLTQGLFLEPGVPKKITVIIQRFSFDKTISPALLGLPPYISVQPIGLVDNSEFDVILTLNSPNTVIHEATVTGLPLCAKPKSFKLYCSFGWTVGPISEVGWTVGPLEVQ